MPKSWLWLSVLIIVIDYFTKQFALTHLILHEPIRILPFFSFTLVHNTGAAFGFLSSVDPSWERWLLTGISIAATGLFYHWYRTCTHTLQRVAIALVIGGAVGNLIDRAFFGYVVDFLDVYISIHHWPAFNIADMAICIGVGLLMISWVKYERHH